MEQVGENVGKIRVEEGSYSAQRDVSTLSISLPSYLRSSFAYSVAYPALQLECPTSASRCPNFLTKLLIAVFPESLDFISGIIVLLTIILTLVHYISLFIKSLLT